MDSLQKSIKEIDGSIDTDTLSHHITSTKRTKKVKESEPEIV